MVSDILRVTSILIPALIGTAFGALLLKRSGRSPALGAAVGALAGVLGPSIFMVPLNFCTFEAERKPLDVVFGLFLAALGTAAVLALLIWVTQTFLAKDRYTTFLNDPAPGAFKGRLTPWLLLLPTLVVLALFLYYPSLDNFRLSSLLTKLGAPRSRFVCVDNFTRLLNEDYYRTVLTTLGISFAIVAIGLVLALLIATLAYQPVKGASIYRTLLIWPYAVSPVVAGLVFFALFNPVAGMVNHILNSLFGIKPPWIQDATLAPWTIILASVWKTIGYNILFYLAGLQNVPKDLLEAAAIDGANAVQRFVRVTIPLLSPITFFLIITNMTYAFFETFGTIDFLTAGGPSKATSTMIYEIYEVGIRGNDLGKGAAQSIILFMLVVGLTFIQFRSTGRRVTYGA